MCKITFKAEHARLEYVYCATVNKVEKEIMKAASKGNDNVSVDVPAEFRVRLSQDLRLADYKATVIYYGNREIATINIAW